MGIRFLPRHSSRMSLEQERRATLPKAKPGGRGPWMGHVRSIGDVDIPQEAFLAILKVEN